MNTQLDENFKTNVTTGLSDAGFILASMVCGFLSYQVYLQSAVGY